MVALIVLFDARALSVIPLIYFAFPRIQSLLDDDVVIQPAVIAKTEAPQRAFLDLPPLIDGISVASEARQDGVVVRQGSGRYLVPGGTPQKDSSTKTEGRP